MRRYSSNAPHEVMDKKDTSSCAFVSWNQYGARGDPSIACVFHFQISYIVGSFEPLNPGSAALACCLVR